MFRPYSATPASAQVPPAILLPDLATSQGDAYEMETVGGAYAGALLTAKGQLRDSDGKYGQTYHAACYVYAGTRRAGDRNGAVERYSRRFAVHAADREALPLIRRVARMLLLLYGENHARMRFDHPYNDTVDVWLTAQAVKAGSNSDAGGEQFKNQIYIYNITADRQPIEWAREVAHEYGHYALPGVSGFKEPEEWANGVLGERLFLNWIYQDARSGVVPPDTVPFVTLAQLDAYISRQVTPLIRRITGTRDTYDGAVLARRDAAGMDSYTALALYLDAVYGSSMLLSAMQYTEAKPGSTFVTAPDFLLGALAALRGATELDISVPVLSGVHPVDNLLVYLPPGEWSVTTQGSIRSWEVRTESKGIHVTGKNLLYITRGDWRRIAFAFGTASAQSVRLLLSKKDAELR